MRYVTLHTSIPVPKVQASYIKDGCGYIMMSKADGEPLARIWKQLDAEHKASVISQLRSYVEQLRSLDGTFYGSLWNQPCEDVVFSHVPFLHEEFHYGPYHSRQQYNDGLVAALEHSLPTHSFGEFEKDLATRIQAITDETKTFSHGDLHLLNIFANHSGDVTAIIDWDSANFSICGRDYYEARDRSRTDEWSVALDEVFPVEARVHFDLSREFNLALTRYTGI
jgi:hypothetical protein